MKKSIHEVRDLLRMELQDMYSAETQILEALPMMAEKATNPLLKEGFRQHLTETKHQVKRLLKVGTILKIEVDGIACEGMKGLLKEGEEVMKLTGDGSIIDEALITSARKVEHYEVLAYKGLIAMTKDLSEDEATDLLQENLAEEEMTDKKLESLSESAGTVAKMVQAGKDILP